MTVWQWLSRLLPVLAIVGLLFAPFTTSAVGAMAAAPMSEMPDMVGMPDDMPCCPDEPRAASDCQKACPLMADCMAKCFAVTTLLAPAVAFIGFGGDAQRRAGDSRASSWGEEPPARPPRT
jgi:hypothetical protein